MLAFLGLAGARQAQAQGLNLFLTEPASGPAGSTIQLASGTPCPPSPGDPAPTVDYGIPFTIPVAPGGIRGEGRETPIAPSGTWSAPLTIPQIWKPGRYPIDAACYVTTPGENQGAPYFSYLTDTFTVTPPSGTPLGKDPPLLLRWPDNSGDATDFCATSPCTESFNFSDPDYTSTGSDYAVTVFWGDGMSSTPPVHLSYQGDPSEANGYYVSATHNFPQTSHFYNVTVMIRDLSGITDAGGSTATGRLTLQVGEPGPPPPVLMKDKTNAKGNLALNALGAGLGCAALGTADLATVGLATGLAAAGCGLAIGAAAAAAADAFDPPSNDYQTLFKPRPYPTAPLPTSLCGQMQRAQCTELLALSDRYLANDATVASIKEALGVTTERYSGARLHHAMRSADRQARWIRQLLAKRARAVQNRRAAGRMLADVLTGDNMDFVVPGNLLPAGIQAFDAELRQPGPVISRAVTRLEQEGLINSMAQLETLLTRALYGQRWPAKFDLAQFVTR